MIWIWTKCKICLKLTNKCSGVVYESDEELRKNKELALNQIGLINYNENKHCQNGHDMKLKKVNGTTDGWYWRCQPKECQKSKSIRIGTFFLEIKLFLWQVLLLIFNFGFEFLNTTTQVLMNVSVQTVADYKRILRLVILAMFNKHNIKLGGPGRVIEIDESLFIRVKPNRGRDMGRDKVWVFGLYERATLDQPKRILLFQVAKK